MFGGARQDNNSAPITMNDDNNIICANNMHCHAPVDRGQRQRRRWAPGRQQAAPRVVINGRRAGWLTGCWMASGATRRAARLLQDGSVIWLGASARGRNLAIVRQLARRAGPPSPWRAGRPARGAGMRGWAWRGAASPGRAPGNNRCARRVALLFIGGRTCASAPFGAPPGRARICCARARADADYRPVAAGGAGRGRPAHVVSRWRRAPVA